MVDDHVLEERNNHDEIGLRGLILIFFDKDNEEFVREGLIEYPYLLMLMNLWSGDSKNQSEGTNMKLDE